MADGLAIRTDVATTSELRRHARRARGRTVQRLPAIANALEGMPRAEAARAAGIERQGLNVIPLRPIMRRTLHVLTHQSALLGPIALAFLAGVGSDVTGGIARSPRRWSTSASS